MGPCKIQCTFDCHHVGKIMAPLYVYVGPTFRLKMTATDQAFWLCRLLVRCFCFSLIKCGVSPKKVSKMVFFVPVKSSRQSLHSYYYNLKCIDQKLRCSAMLGTCAILWVGWTNSAASKKRCWVGLCSKVVSAVGFS